MPCTKSRTAHPALDTTIRLGDRVILHPREDVGRLIAQHDDGTVTVRVEGEERRVAGCRVAYWPSKKSIAWRKAKIREYNDNNLLDS